MLKAVLYKIWSRPLILTVFLLICLAQPVSVLLHHQENMRQLCEYYNAWGGRWMMTGSSRLPHSTKGFGRSRRKRQRTYRTHRLSSRLF